MPSPLVRADEESWVPFYYRVVWSTGGDSVRVPYGPHGAGPACFDRRVGTGAG